MKHTENLMIGGWLLGAVVLMMGTSAEATRMYTFADWGDFSTVCSINMANGDNLLVRVGGVDLSVTAAGYGAGYWHLGLTNEEGYVVGWAKNFNKSIPGRECRLVGKYSGVAPIYDGQGNLLYKGLSFGEKPVHIFLVYDSTDNGWDLIGGQIGSTADLAEGDLFFTEEDILFGPDKLLGAVDLLPGYGADAILPNMTVVIPPPPPVTIDLLSPAHQSVERVPPQTLQWEDSGDFYDVYFGEDPNNLVLISENQTAASFVLGTNDLDFATTYYWQVSMMQEQELIESEIWSFTTAGFVCQTAYTADLNGDCKVDLVDMALFCQDWLKESNRLWPGQ